MHIRNLVIAAASILAVLALAGASSAAIGQGPIGAAASVQRPGNLGPSAKRGLYYTGGTPSASGCRTVDVWKNGYSFLFHSLVYRFHQMKYFCWYGGRVTYASVTHRITDLDPNWYFRGLAASAGWYTAGSRDHYSLREGKLENCVVKFACLGSEEPWVEITAHGNGTYDYDYGS